MMEIKQPLGADVRPNAEKPKNLTANAKIQHRPAGAVAKRHADAVSRVAKGPAKRPAGAVAKRPAGAVAKRLRRPAGNA